MKKCVLLVFCMFLLLWKVNAQSFHTTMIIKKSDCDTINGKARVVTDVTTGFYNYRWSNGITIDSIRDVIPGTYYVTVTHYDVIGNLIDSLIDTAIITYNSVSISIFSIANPTCGANNGRILSSITGGSGSYTFYTIGSGINYGAGINLPAGLFQVVAFDIISGCYSDTISVVLRDTGAYFSIRDTIIQDVNCFGDTNGSISISVTGGVRPYRYSWSTTSIIDTFVNNLSAGTYSVSITDALCPTINRVYNFIVKGPADSLRLIANFINDTCYRKVANIHLTTLGGNTGSTFYWIDGSVFSGNRDSLNAGIYVLAVVDTKGCTDTISVNIGNSGGPSANVNLLDSSCIGLSNGNIRVIVTSRDRPHHYTWSHDVTLDTNLLVNLAAGIYTVTITNNLMCDTVMTINLSNYIMPTLDVIGDTTIIQGQQTTLSALIDQSFIDSSYWIPTYNLVDLNTNASVFPLNTTIYTYNALLNNGCKLMDSVIVHVDSIPIELRIPNIFTPNSDGVNDLFKITSNEAVRNIELHIYDRWGNNIFDSYDKNLLWDGINMYNGKLSETGVYTYFLYVDTFINKNRIIKEGNISLIR